MTRKIYILPMILFPAVAGAYTETVYYDSTGQCEDFCLVQYNGVGCCPTAQSITGAEIFEKFKAEAEKRDEKLGSFKIGDTVVMDETGFKLNGKQINNMGLDATSSKVSGTSTCVSGTNKNDYGACIQVATSDDDQPVTYIPTSISQSGDQQYITRSDGVTYEFRLVFHSCTAGNCPDGTISGGVADGYTLYCKPVDPEHDKRTLCYSDASYSTPVNTLPVPTNAGYEFRGYYHGINDGGTMKFYDWGLVTACSGGSMNQSTCESADGFWSHIRTINNGSGTQEIYACLGISESVCRNTYHGVSTNQHVGWHEICSTRSTGDPYCIKLKTEANTNVGSPLDRFFPRGGGIIYVNQTDQYGNNRPMRVICPPDASSCTGVTIDVYGAWARKCAPGANATCDLEIGSLWTNFATGFQKGDVRYTTGCDQGYTYQKDYFGGTFEPQCIETTGGGDAKINLVFKGLSTETCNLNVNRALSCTPGEDDTITLPGNDDVACADGYHITGWTINNTNYTLGGAPACTTTVLNPDGVGTVSVEPQICGCNLIGIKDCGNAICNPD